MQCVVLITGARAPIALEMARSFKNAGCKVLMADSIRLALARWSSSVDAYFMLPSPRFQLAEFTKILKQIILNENVVHLIPTCEEAFYISHSKDSLPCNVWTAPFFQMNILHNKHTFFQEFNKILPMPETKLVNSFDLWEESMGWVFKPIYSRFAQLTIIGKKISKNDFSGVKSANWIAQKCIHGKEICVYSIWEKGIMKAYAAYSPRYRVGKGSGIFLEPIENLEILSYVKKLGEHLSYHGQLSFDVIVGSDNIPYFIECNPRGTSGAHFLGQELAHSFLTSKTFICKNPASYKIGYAVTLLHPLKTLHSHVRNAKDVVFSYKDPLPYIFQSLSLIEIIYEKYRKKTTWLEATTGNIEWNGDPMGTNP